MTQFSKAINESELNWYRVNLTKRKELDAFRNIIIEKVNAINTDLFGNNAEFVGDEDKTDVDDNKRSFLIPSNSTDVDGYYEAIMNNIKFSCWVKCTEEELNGMLNELNSKQITADASRKSNSGTIRVADENEVNTLRWIITHKPQNLFRVSATPKEAVHATLVVQGGVVLAGKLVKMRGKVETDKFYFNVIDTTLFMIVSKGTANESGDFRQEYKDAKKAKGYDEINSERHWMVLRASRGSEQTLENRLTRWMKYKEEQSNGEELGIQFETYLPIFWKEVKKGSSQATEQRKALFCPGYLFIRTSINDLLKLETDKTWDGGYISRLLVRESRKIDITNKAMTISDRSMDDFKFIVNSNLTNITLEADDFIDKEYVRYFNKESALHQKIGQIMHKGDKLFITFCNLDGLMSYFKGTEVNSSEIRKLTKKELIEAGLQKSRK